MFSRVFVFKDKSLQEVVSLKVGSPPPNATLTLNASTAGSRAAGSFQPICHHPPRLLILFTLQRCWNNQRLCPHPSSSSSPFIEDIAGLWYIIQRSRIMQRFTLQAFPNNHLPEMRSHSLVIFCLLLFKFSESVYAVLCCHKGSTNTPLLSLVNYNAQSGSAPPLPDRV